MSIFSNVDLNDANSRKKAWANHKFRQDLSEYAGKVVADNTNAFFEGEISLDAEVVSDFFTWNDYFILGFLWLDLERHVLERHVYVETITESDVRDGIINGYGEFTSEPSRYSDNPIPNLEATYY